MWMALLPLTQALELVHRGSTFRVLGGSRKRASRWTPEYVKLLLSPRHSRGITLVYLPRAASARDDAGRDRSLDQGSRVEAGSRALAKSVRGTWVRIDAGGALPRSVPHQTEKGR